MVITDRGETAMSERKPETIPEQKSFPTTLEDLTRQLLVLVGKLTGMESAYLTRIDLQAGRQSVLHSRNSGKLDIGEGLEVDWVDTLCRRALEDSQWHSADISATWPNAELARKIGLKSYASVPVRLADGTLYGTLCSASSRSVELDDDVRNIMALFSDLLARQIEGEWLTETAHLQALQSESPLTRVSLLSEIGQLCMEARSLLPAVAESADQLRRFGLWRTIIPFQMVDGQPRTLDPDEHRFHDLIAQTIKAFGDSVSRHHDEHNHLILTDQKELASLDGLREAAGLESHGPIGLLTAATTNDLQAGILVLADQSAPIEERDIDLLTNCSNYLSMLTDRLHHQGRLEESNRELSILASRDNLTGLPNRRSLLENLEQLMDAADENRGQILLAFIDLDGFKRINDQHGHETGDLFLISIARRLQNALREDDLVARLGGDEFVVVTTAGASRNTHEIARHLSERIDNAIIGEHNLGSVSIDYPGASTGVVVWQGESLRELIKKGDEAMYQVKQRRGRTP